MIFYLLERLYVCTVCMYVCTVYMYVCMHVCRDCEGAYLDDEAHFNIGLRVRADVHETVVIQVGQGDRQEEGHVHGLHVRHDVPDQLLQHLERAQF